MERLAIIGSGIAGMGCAHFLQRDFDLTVFEQYETIGGHTNTVTAPEPGTGREVPIDTGFMVYNEVTYPLLTRLFAELDVPIKKTDMSFSVRHTDSGLEFCGSSLNHLFAQRKNLLSPRFWRMLASINRFNKEAFAALDDPATAGMTLADYVRARGYGEDFFNLYLVPMSSAVWSTPPELMLTFPAASLLRFFHNHGFLGLDTQHQWLTVEGGSREYRNRLIAPFKDRIRTQQKIVRVVRPASAAAGKLTLMTSDGRAESFDKVIIATHADQALRMLVNPLPDEARLLGEFHYQPNVATLHTDVSVLPKTRLAWASWNYEVARDAAGRVSAATHYWMNNLQGVSPRENYIVSINRPEAVDPAKVLRTIHYEHPLFSLGAAQAQTELPTLNERARGRGEVYFAGSYFRYGFHEDAFMSAVNLSGLLLGRDPWPTASAP